MARFWIALVLAAGMFVGRANAATVEDCSGIRAARGTTVEPTACVDYGTHLTFRSEGFLPGQVVSALILGPQGLVGGADWSAHAGAEGVVVVDVDTASFRGVALAGGDYLFVARDITGRRPAAEASFRVVGSPSPPPVEPVAQPEPAPDAMPAASPPKVPAGIPMPQGACAAREPLPVEGAQAWMVAEHPAVKAVFTLCTRLIVDGKVTAGARVVATASSAIGAARLPAATTRTDGVAPIAFRLANAAPGQPLRVTALIVYAGHQYEAETSFTPN